MKTTELKISKINQIAMQVMREVNAEREDHSKTMRLLEDLQMAIQESRTQKQAS